MKKTQRKALRLNKETLVHLRPGQMGRVLGGVIWTWAEACPTAKLNNCQLTKDIICDLK